MGPSNTWCMFRGMNWGTTAVVERDVTFTVSIGGGDIGHVM